MENKKIIAIVDCLTGLVIQREMTEQELEQINTTTQLFPMENINE